MKVYQKSLSKELRQRIKSFKRNKDLVSQQARAIIEQVQVENPHLSRDEAQDYFAELAMLSWYELDKVIASDVAIDIREYRSRNWTEDNQIKKLSEWIKHRGMTQDQVADILELAKGTGYLSKVSRRERWLKLDTLLGLLEVLNIKFEQIDWGQAVADNSQSGYQKQGGGVVHDAPATRRTATADRPVSKSFSNFWSSRYQKRSPEDQGLEKGRRRRSG